MTDQATPPSPPAQAGYPAQPGDANAAGGAYPPPAGGYPAADPQAATPAKPSVARGIVKRIIGAVVVFGVIGIGGIAWSYLSGAPETAKVGDCLSGQSADALKTVECSDPKAEHKVAAKIEDKTEAEFEAADVETLCAGHPTTENAFWEGKEGGKGYVLCLAPVG